MRCYATLVSLLLALAFTPAAVSAETAGGFCDGAHPFALADDLSGIASPCAVAPRSFLIETVYLQNASAVGGTALAAYPLVRVRTGLLRRVELVVDPPSQIAESQPGGGGLYPPTHFGYGIDYTIAQTSRSAVALQTQVQPPNWRFAPSHNGQPRYVVGLSSEYLVTRRLSLGVAASGTSSGQVGFERVLPSLSIRAAYATSAAIEIATDLGTRIVSRRAVAQSFGDVAVNHRLTKSTFFTVGLGTTFNAVTNAKAHYLASGFNFRR